MHDGLLQHLRIHHKRWNIRVLTQPRHHGIIDITHTALQRQKLRRDPPARHLFQQKRYDVIGDLLADRIGVIEHVSAVGEFCIDYRNNLVGINLHVPGAHAIHRMINGDAVATRRCAGNNDISQFSDAWVVVVIQLNDDFLRP